MIQVEINQSLLDGSQRLNKAILDKVLRETSKALGNPKALISVAFISPEEMREFNRTLRGKDCLTDVLSFELNEESLKGEVLISYDQAKRQAKEVGHSVRKEVMFLLVHGILHIFGHDHEKPAEKEKMFVLQEQILKALGVDPHL
ncbi:MAG: rRNA maturation RNase YbeY [Parcubacteria group bacterium]|nr:rRNA maturation RNase YbeY [Parcubacteria group bacterium]